MSKIRTLFIYLLISTLFCTACSSDYDQTIKTAKKVNNMDEYIAFGKIHNELLEVAENVCETSITRSDNFSFLGSDSTLFRQIHTEQLLAVDKMALIEQERDYLKTALSENTRFYQTDNVYAELQSNDGSYSLEDEISQLFGYRVIDDFELVLLNILTNYINENSEDQDTKKLKKNIYNLKKMWNSYYGNKEEKAGVFSGQVIGIAVASIDWWDENYQETRALPAWVGADAAGAIVGAVHNAAIQYCTSKKVNLTQVGYHALGGAVISSTGIVKIVGTWISKVI